MANSTVERLDKRDRFVREWDTDEPGKINVNLGATPLCFKRSGLWVPNSEFGISGSVNGTIATSTADDFGLSVSGKTITIRTPAGTTVLTFDGIWGQEGTNDPVQLWKAPNNLKPGRMTVLDNSIEYDLGNYAVFRVEVWPEGVRMTLRILRNPMEGLPVNYDRVWLEFDRAGADQEWLGVSAVSAMHRTRAAFLETPPGKLRKGIDTTYFANALIFPIEVDPTVAVTTSNSGYVYYEDMYGTYTKYQDSVYKMYYADDGKGTYYYYHHAFLDFDLSSYPGTISAVSFYHYNVSPYVGGTVYAHESGSAWNWAVDSGSTIYNKSQAHDIQLGGFATAAGWTSESAAGWTTYAAANAGGHLYAIFRNVQLNGNFQFDRTTYAPYLSFTYVAGGGGPTTIASYMGVPIANWNSVDSVAKANIDAINGAT